MGGEVLFIDFEACTGCRICEMVCSLHHEGVVNPAKSRIRVVGWEEEGVYVPLSCQQCDEPFCEKVCPVKATYRDEKTRAMLVNHDLCIGCRSCIMACPFEGPALDPEAKKILKCDLCGGEPRCVAFCPTSALKYLQPTSAMLEKKNSAFLRRVRMLRVKLAKPLLVKG